MYSFKVECLKQENSRPTPVYPTASTTGKLSGMWEMEPSIILWTCMQVAIPDSRVLRTFLLISAMVLENHKLANATVSWVKVLNGYRGSLDKNTRIWF